MSVSQEFSGKRAAEVVGITYRQLDYWARTDLIRPSLADASGSGSRRKYAYRDLLELRIIKQLVDAGIKLEQVRGVFRQLRQLVGDDIASANLVIDGASVALALDDGELIDLVNQGQGVLNILRVARCREEVDAAIVELRRHEPAAPSATGRAEAQSAAESAQRGARARRVGPRAQRLAGRLVRWITGLGR